MQDKTQEQIYSEKYPEKEYTKTIYNFTQEELRKVQSIDTLVQMGQIAQMMLNQVVQNEALKRVGAPNSPDIGVLYNVPSGQFFVWTPRVWCSACKNRKALYGYKERNYCEECLKLAQLADKSPLKEAKIEKKKTGGK